MIILLTEYPPVFTTQLNDNASTGRHPVYDCLEYMYSPFVCFVARDSTSCTVNAHGSAKRNHIHSETEKTDDFKTKPKTQTEISGTNFIKRNIEV